MTPGTPASHTATATDEDGFSLVELMVVVLVIGVLVAIAIPTYAAARGRAGDRSVQSDLRTGIVNAKAIAASGDGRFVVDGAASVTADEFADALNGVEGAITWYTTYDPALERRAVAVDVEASGDAVLLYKRSESGRYFGIASLRTGRVLFCEGDAPDDVDVVPGAPDADGNPQAGCSDARW